ncbi:MAG: nuclease-related domain-containing protein [Rhodocyclales bacterium]|nr:nuclease-related domain-containing protein [Rhodocyclales bacterium]
MLIKSQDDKSKRLRLLDELQKSDRLDDSQKKWLREEYWRLAPGVAGERDAAHYLDMTFGAGKNNALLHDLRIEADGLTAQIDHLVVSRVFVFFLLETKSFKGNLHINEQGEFTVEYSDGRRFGIESPLEQSRRHEVVLRRVVERLGIGGRIGTSPRFEHVVLVHPKGVIHRPPSDRFDSSRVIKADQFQTWFEGYIEGLSVPSTLSTMLNLRGRDTVREWGEMLRAEHQPSNPLKLPDFMKPKAASIVKPEAVSQATPAAEATTSLSASKAAQAGPQRANCATCGRHLTPRVAQYCVDKADWFGGRLYCMDHQAEARVSPKKS